LIRDVMQTLTHGSQTDRPVRLLERSFSYARSSVMNYSELEPILRRIAQRERGLRLFRKKRKLIELIAIAMFRRGDDDRLPMEDYVQLARWVCAPKGLEIVIRAHREYRNAGYDIVKVAASTAAIVTSVIVPLEMWKRGVPLLPEAEARLKQEIDQLREDEKRLAPLRERFQKRIAFGASPETR
jgi:hypothetical protein